MSKGIVFRTHNNEKIYPCPYYPIGSVYISFSATDPSTYFGGTWERIKGRFLLSADDGTYKINNTGGEATHQLTVNEMPSHNHAIGYRTNTSITTGSTGQWTTDPGTSTAWSDGSCIQNRGGNQAHNNMPPYIVVYMWKRTG